MDRILSLLFAIFISYPAVAGAKDKAPLKQVGTIHVDGVEGGDFDHWAGDVEGQGLFLPGEEHDKSEVLEAKTNQRIHTMMEIKAPHAVLFRKDRKEFFVVEGDASAVRIYDSENFKPLGEVKVSIDADSIAYDSATNYLYVVNGGREAHTPYSLISVIDTNNSKKLRDIKILTNHVEAIVLEKSGPRMFINLTGKDAVGVMDRNKTALSATWPLPTGDKSNVAMAFDEANRRLFVVARIPGK